MAFDLPMYAGSTITNVVLNRVMEVKGVRLEACVRYSLFLWGYDELLPDIIFHFNSQS